MNTSEPTVFGVRPDGRFMLSFLEAPATEVCKELCRWGSDCRYIYKSYLLKDNRKGYRIFLGEYITPPNSGVLMPTLSPWCAFIDNCRIGGIPRSELFSLSERMRVRSVAFLGNDSDRGRALPHVVQFDFYDGTQGKLKERSVGVIHETVWEFSEYGHLLPFEQADAYRKPEKRDRLTYEMLERYASALGIRLDGSDGFYRYEEAIGLRWHVSPEAVREPPQSVAQKLVNLFTKAMKEEKGSEQ